MFYSQKQDPPSPVVSPADRTDFPNSPDYYTLLQVSSGLAWGKLNFKELEPAHGVWSLQKPAASPSDTVTCAKSVP